MVLLLVKNHVIRFSQVVSTIRIFKAFLLMTHDVPLSLNTNLFVILSDLKIQSTWTSLEESECNRSNQHTRVISLVTLLDVTHRLPLLR